MKTLFQNSLLTFSLLTEKQPVLLFEWTDQTKQMDYTNFQLACNAYAGFAWQYQAKHLLVDTRHFHFHLPKEFEAWRETQLNPRYESLGVKKFAYVTPPEWLSLMKDIPGQTGKFATRHFTSAPDAMQWLNADDHE
ncbi:MAG: STAS/SEC14 domain-containing protein [Cyclobacteriaceae bacterium]|jgi:hypothetical protein|nr:STAS/SEC14 domain-containing protein [Cyclobacteriaceae bacterium]